MVTSGYRVLQLALIVATITLCNAGGWPGYEHFHWIDKHWPDLTCHPVFEEDHRRNGTLMHSKHVWVECLEKEKETGNCAKLCFLERKSIVSRKNGENPIPDSKDPVRVKVDSFSHHLRTENGYWDGLGGAAADQICNKVEEEMEKCKKKHTEITNMPMHVPCDKWNPFLSCIEKAYGCV